MHEYQLQNNIYDGNECPKRWVYTDTVNSSDTIKKHWLNKQVRKILAIKINEGHQVKLIRKGE